MKVWKCVFVCVGDSLYVCEHVPAVLLHVQCPVSSGAQWALMMQRALNVSIWKLMLILGIDEEEREVGKGADDEQQWHGKGAMCYKQKIFEKGKVRAEPI